VLVRVWIQTMRNRSRERPTDDEQLESAAPDDQRADVRLEDAATQSEAVNRVAQLRSVLDRVAERVIRGLRTESAQANGRRTWNQLGRLAFERAKLKAFIEPQAFVDPLELRRARDAIYAAHSRFRKAIAEAIDPMVEASELAPEDAELARAAMVVLTR
jgi:hypothetical protein